MLQGSRNAWKRRGSELLSFEVGEQSLQAALFFLEFEREGAPASTPEFRAEGVEMGLRHGNLLLAMGLV